MSGIHEAPWIGSVIQLFDYKIPGLVMCIFNSVKVETIFTTRSAFLSS